MVFESSDTRDSNQPYETHRKVPADGDTRVRPVLIQSMTTADRRGRLYYTDFKCQSNIMSGMDMIEK